MNSIGVSSPKSLFATSRDAGKAFGTMLSTVLRRAFVIAHEAIDTMTEISRYELAQEGIMTNVETGPSDRAPRHLARWKRFPCAAVFC